MSKLRIFGWMVSLAVCGWVGQQGYYFFFDTTQPQLLVSGVKNGDSYAGDVSCQINGEHPYKVKTISIVLDGKPLVHNFSIGKSSFEHPFTLPTKTLVDGKHNLQISVVDGTFRKNKVIKNIDFNVDNIPLQTAFVKSNTDFRVFQGRTLHLQFQANKELKEAYVNLFSQRHPCFPESKNSLIYEAYVPIECEAKANEYMLAIDCYDKVSNVVQLEGKLQVVPFPFKKSTLHVSSKKVEEEKEIGASQDLLNEEIKKLASLSPQEKLWNGSFYVPTEIIRISTEFGTIRTTQEKGRYAHKGIDVVNTPKSVIWAPQDGKIIIKERYAFSGNTVVLDHGWGVFSLFYHLDSFPDSLRVGQSIKKGNPIGRLGKTGYASGYHLHWEMRVNNTEVDPLEWTKPGF